MVNSIVKDLVGWTLDREGVFEPFECNWARELAAQILAEVEDHCQGAAWGPLLYELQVSYFATVYQLRTD